jgi:hypothetical protein
MNLCDLVTLEIAPLLQGSWEDAVQPAFALGQKGHSILNLQDSKTIIATLLYPYRRPTFSVTIHSVTVGANWGGFSGAYPAPVAGWVTGFSGAPTVFYWVVQYRVLLGNSNWGFLGWGRGRGGAGYPSPNDHTDNLRIYKRLWKREVS